MQLPVTCTSFPHGVPCRLQAPDSGFCYAAYCVSSCCSCGADTASSLMTAAASGSHLWAVFCRHHLQGCQAGSCRRCSNQVTSPGYLQRPQQGAGGIRLGGVVCPQGLQLCSLHPLNSVMVCNLLWQLSAWSAHAVPGSPAGLELLRTAMLSPLLPPLTEQQIPAWHGSDPVTHAV